MTGVLQVPACMEHEGVEVFYCTRSREIARELLGDRAESVNGEGGADMLKELRRCCLAVTR